jgi:hypothetical protein
MAIESTQNIRTVLELNRQNAFCDRYATVADESVKYAALNTNGSGVASFAPLIVF